MSRISTSVRWINDTTVSKILFVYWSEMNADKVLLNSESCSHLLTHKIRFGASLQFYWGPEWVGWPPTAHLYWEPLMWWSSPYWYKRPVFITLLIRLSNTEWRKLQKIGLPRITETTWSIFPLFSLYRVHLVCFPMCCPESFDLLDHKTVTWMIQMGGIRRNTSQNF